MNVIDKELLLNAAKLSSAVYTEDPTEMQKEMEALGYVFLGLVTNGVASDQGDHQVAVLKAADKRNVLVCRGTQVEENFSFSELLDDANTELNEYGTFKGFQLPEAMLDEINRLTDPNQPFDVYGHSKGGSEAEELGGTLPAEYKVRVVSFGAPCCGTKKFWNQILDDVLHIPVELYRVIADGDFAPGWGLDSGGYQPVPAILLKAKHEPQWTNDEHWHSLLNGGLGPHSITESYIKLLS